MAANLAELKKTKKDCPALIRRGKEEDWEIWYCREGNLATVLVGDDEYAKELADADADFKLHSFSACCRNYAVEYLHEFIKSDTSLTIMAMPPVQEC